MVFGGFELHRYFFVWANNPLTKIAYYKKFYDLGLLIKSLPLKTHNQIVFNPDLASESQTDWSEEKAQTTTAFTAYPKLASYTYVKPENIASLGCSDATIILIEYDKRLIKNIQQQCPSLKPTTAPAAHSQEKFYIFDYSRP